MTYDLRITQLRYTAAQFKASNPVPLSGQLCLETDSGVTKTGDGTTAYLSLPLTTLSGDERRSADDLWAARNGGGVVISVNGVRYDELITVSGSVDAESNFVIDFTNLSGYPGITAVSYVSSHQTEGNPIVGIPGVFDLDGYKVAFVDVSDGAAAPEGALVQATFMVKY